MQRDWATQVPSQHVGHMTVFTLTVATSADAYIARAIDDAPQNWASPEEQELFFRDVEAADWAIMGRHTHEAADRPERRRIIFSAENSGWRRPTQLWLDPSELSPDAFAPLVSSVYPCSKGLILGGTRVHDWFLSHNAIDVINLTVEPVIFGGGLPVFGDQRSDDPLTVFRSRGFEVASEEKLNDAGTMYYRLRRVKESHRPAKARVV